MQLSNLSLALTAIYGSGFAWRNLFADGTPGFRVNVEEALRLNQQALGPELVVNGDFSQGTAGWTALNATIDVVDGELRVTGVGGYGSGRQIVPVTPGKTYVVRWRQRSVDGAPAQGYARPAGWDTTTGQFAASPTTGASWIDVVGVVVAIGSSLYMRMTIAQSSAGGVIAFDNISVREIDLSKCVIFQDSAGTLPVTAMEQPLGLILDTKMGAVQWGDELCPDGAFNAQGAWVLSDGAVISGGHLSLPTLSLSTGEYPIQTLAGRVYRVTATASAITFCGAWAELGKKSVLNDLAGISTAKSRTGSLSFTFRATGPTSYIAFIATGSTTPTIDNVSVVELPDGNHFVQPSNTASRPIVSRRYNLLTATEDFANAAWASPNVSGATRVGAALTVTSDEGYAYVRQAVAGMLFGVGHRLFIRAVCNQTITSVPIRVTGASGSTSVSALVNFEAGVPQDISLEGFVPATTAYMEFGVDARNAIVPGGSNEIGYVLTILRADLRLSADAIPSIPAYQRVTSPTDYDEAGFPAYAKFDGVDDWLESGVVDMTGTDEVTVIAGVTKERVAEGLVFETSSNATNGSVTVSTGFGGPNNLFFASRGSTERPSINYNFGQMPMKVLLSCESKISAPLVSMRVNGSQVAANTGDQGTGNYGAHKAYIGRRGGASLPFNGRVYGVTVIGKLLTSAQLAAAERYERELMRLP